MENKDILEIKDLNDDDLIKLYEIVVKHIDYLNSKKVSLGSDGEADE